MDYALIFNSITAVVALAAAIAAITPTPKDDKILAVIVKVLNFIGMNWGQATNAKEVFNSHMSKPFDIKTPNDKRRSK